MKKEQIELLYKDLKQLIWKFENRDIEKERKYKEIIQIEDIADAIIKSGDRELIDNIHNLLLGYVEDLKEELFFIIKSHLETKEIFIQALGAKIFQSILYENPDLVTEGIAFMDFGFTHHSKEMREMSFYSIYTVLKKNRNSDLCFEVLVLMKKYLNHPEDKNNRILNTALFFFGKIAKAIPDLKNEMLEIAVSFVTNKDKVTKEEAFLIFYKLSKYFKQEMLKLVTQYTTSTDLEVKKIALETYKKIEKYKKTMSL